MAYNSLFSKTPAIFGDQYAYTMGAVDFKAGEVDRVSTSQIFFRELINNGFKDGEGEDLKIPYFVVAGLGPFFEWFDNNWKLTDDEATFYASLKDPGGERIYPDAYLQYMQTEPAHISIDAMLEGELAFPDEPIARLTGPHLQVERLEAGLLNLITAHSGWSTIASQFWLAAQRLTKHASLYEFAARRTPEWGGLGTSRSAYLAGWDGTSNMYAGYTYGIPTAGTMAHAFIMVRESEVEAFTTWVKNMPHMGVFLVDTYDTIEGVRNAISVCKQHGVKLRGIRLDSGDVDYLSHLVREELDAAGFKDTIIMASDSLNVGAIHQIYQVKEAPLNSFGVGGNYSTRRQDTKGISAVMKAARVNGRNLMKFSNAADKSTLPGIHDVIRYIEPAKHNGIGHYAGDTIIPYDLDVGSGRLNREIVSIPRRSPNGVKPFPEGVEFYRPIVSVTKDGKHLLQEFIDQDSHAVLKNARARFFHSMQMLAPEHKQIISPRLYIAGIEEGLLDDQAHRVRANNLNIQRGRQARRFAPAPGKTG